MPNNLADKANSSAIKSGFLVCAAKHWDVVQDLWWTLMPARFSLLSVVVGIFALIVADQGREVLLAVAEGHLVESALMFVATLIWATVAWFWARTALQIDDRSLAVRAAALNSPDIGDKRLNALRSGVPRVLGTAAFLVLAVAYVVVLINDGRSVVDGTRRGLEVMIALYILAAAVFFVVVWKRRKFLPAASPGSSLSHSLFAATQDPTKRYGGFLELPRGAQVYLLLTAVVSTLIFIVATLWPVEFARAVGPGFVLIIAAATFIPFGTVLVTLSRRRDLPLLTFVALLVIVFSAWNNNHTVRLLAQPPDPRENITELFEKQWAKDQPPDADGKRIPVVIVATAGGASRAAYLTATVLGMLQDDDPDFARHVFAISGVSGGSLGAATFQALLAASPNGKPTCHGPDGVVTGFARCAQLFLEQDFLGPTLAGMLYPDVVQRFLPFAMLPDRAEAIERAWEDGWVRVMGDQVSVKFTDAFTKVRGAMAEGVTSKGWLPLLFLNGTSVATGSRIVAAQAQFEGKQLSDSLDLLGLLPSDIRLSTAVDMSTRFPYVEPAGVLPGPCGKPWDRIVDGGYFENFGATTAFDIVWTLRGLPGFESKYRPIIIQISNDSGYRGVDSEIERWQNITHGRDDHVPSMTLSETKDPVSALAETRGARGRYMVNAMARTACQKTHATGGDTFGDFIEFRIFGKDEDASGAVSAKDPPLGWRLSNAAQDAITMQVGGRQAHNASAFARVRYDLGHLNGGRDSQSANLNTGNVCGHIQ